MKNTPTIEEKKPPQEMRSCGGKCIYLLSFFSLNGARIDLQEMRILLQAQQGIGSMFNKYFQNVLKFDMQYAII